MNRLDDIKISLMSAGQLTIEDVIWLIDTVDKLLEINEQLRPKTWEDSYGQIYDRER